MAGAVPINACYHVPLYCLLCLSFENLETDMQLGQKYEDNVIKRQKRLLGVEKRTIERKVHDQNWKELYSRSKQPRSRGLSGTVQNRKRKKRKRNPQLAITEKIRRRQDI